MLNGLSCPFTAIYFLTNLLYKLTLINLLIWRGNNQTKINIVFQCSCTNRDCWSLAEYAEIFTTMDADNL
jgi:hypothetical protein